MHGGKRPKAGRKPGAITQRTREIADRAVESGLSPLDYMLTIMRDDTKPEAARFEAAKASAPYVHPRLAATELTGRNGGPLELVSKTQRDAAVQAAMRADA